ncbi:ATP-binding protein [Nocardioides sp. CFH 31398]|uniref:sensor histidine kinase n=1 Tax=Nocardioides sp. CFH 31398 TaxID=2919579 RepID=UPI001F0701BB|nr:GAF domain-containing sensor histidine kinase [Nocardioides sp. CFH 31398]MCH1866832.1 GAF domain-containing sensor histidine kinase [Nocardioides sp. CFH 31398]
MTHTVAGPERAQEAVDLDAAVRAAAIRKYGVLADPHRDDLRALTEVAAMVADVPMATINLITEHEQHQIAAVGFDAAVCSREDSMCASVLTEAEPVVLSDASTDARFAHNPFVTGEIGRVRFYASHQLVTPTGETIGTLCVFDTRPRTITPERRSALKALADRVVDLLELHLRSEELAAAVADLESARQELQRSNEHLTAFAGQVSHDLRGPLTAVSTSLMMLADELEAEHTVARSGDGADPTVGSDSDFLVARALSGATRMQSLIDGLLSFARVGGELRREPVDMDLVARTVQQDLAVDLEGATVEVTDLPTATGDPVQLRAVLQNLVANAAKYTRPGEPAHLTIRGERRDGWVRVEVHDRGPGVPADKRESVFRPLVQLDSRTPGSGIGLATCQRVVESHGGRIGLDDSSYGGTLAWFELPD